MRRYILGFFTAAATALALWLLHRTFPCPLTALLAPANGSPWEMGKLLFWPYLPAALVIWRLGPERGCRGVLLGFWVTWAMLRRRALASPVWQVAGAGTVCCWR